MNILTKIIEFIESRKIIENHDICIHCGSRKIVYRGKKDSIFLYNTTFKKYSFRCLKCGKKFIITKSVYDILDYRNVV